MCCGIGSRNKIKSGTGGWGHSRQTPPTPTHQSRNTRQACCSVESTKVLDSEYLLLSARVHVCPLVANGTLP